MRAKVMMTMVMMVKVMVVIVIIMAYDDDKYEEFNSLMIMIIA